MIVEIPPAQDSPKHILNVLNDDCIQAIFRRLDNVNDFLSAAETCIRFQENAQLSFRSQYKVIRIGRININFESYKIKYIVAADRVEKFLSIFGYLITKLDARSLSPLIAHYCGPNLKTLRVDSSANFNTRSPLQVLMDLNVDGANVYNFKYYSQLRRLKVTGMDITRFDWLVQPFPNLEIANFDILHRLEYNQAVAFLTLNPQLKKLNIQYCGQISSHVFEKMAQLTPSLEVLLFRETANNSSPKSNENLIHVSKLRNLNSLGLHSFSEIPVGRLIDSLIENNTPIEYLSVTMADVENYSTPEWNTSQLKSLKKLCLTQITDETLISIVKNLPTLEELIAPLNSKITIMGIKKALQYAKQLSVLVIELHGITMDLDDFLPILKLAKVNRVKVTIYVENGSVNVPNSLLKENREWFDIIIGGSSSSTWLFGNHFDK